MSELSQERCPKCGQRKTQESRIACQCQGEREDQDSSEVSNSWTSLFLFAGVLLLGVILLVVLFLLSGFPFVFNFNA